MGNNVYRCVVSVHAVCARMVNYRVWGYRCWGADVGLVGWRGAGVGGGRVQVWGWKVWKDAGVKVGEWRDAVVGEV